MKLLTTITLILFFLFSSTLIKAQTADEQSVKITEPLLPTLDVGFRILQIEQFSEITLWERNITFSNQNNSISFSKDKIEITNDTSTQVIPVDSVVLIIMEEVISETMQHQYKQINQLQLKVRFYEKHYGKLEGNMNEDCLIFTPNKEITLPKKCTVKQM